MSKKVTKITIIEPIYIKDFANMLKISEGELINKLYFLGIEVSSLKDGVLSLEVASLVGLEYGVELILDNKNNEKQYKEV